ncbi:MAG TPA: hypothetical protein PK414_02765 [Anaerolineales bacterium]|nr:hypothetical protein [Anaerolineales bacterium]
MTESFEQAWERVAVPKDGKFVSMELRPLLQRAYESLITSSIDLNEIKISLENLLSFLATDAGRTTANCYATDLFFCLSDWDDEVGWESLPEPLTILIGDLGGALHDTVSHPEIAKNFDSLPEQLLERIKQWKLEC